MKLSQRQLQRQLLDSPNTFATVLLVLAADRYGLREVCGWHPQTLQMELQADFDVDIPSINMDKLVVAITIVTSDDFFRRPPSFIQICNVLSGSELSSEFNKADVYECAWGLTEALLLDPPDTKLNEEPLHEEIRHYLGRVVDEAGIKNPKGLLRLAILPTYSGQADYSDMSPENPDLFAIGFQNQEDTSQVIEDMLHKNLAELFEQLEYLELQNGSTKDLLKKIKGKLTA